LAEANCAGASGASHPTGSPVWLGVKMFAVLEISWLFMVFHGFSKKVVDPILWQLHQCSNFG
jgi:hypothetical protein